MFQTAPPPASWGKAFCPLWAPDRQRLVLDWLADGRASLAVQPADGTAAPQVLVAGDIAPSSFTPDGLHLAAVMSPFVDIVIVTVEGGQARVQPLIQTPHLEGWPALSQDGQWLAYVSDVSGAFEVYVQPYPGPGPRTQVSIEGGRAPASESEREGAVLRQ